MKRVLAAAALAAMLAGCQTLTPAQYGAQQCAGIGIGPDHPHYAPCVQAMMQDNYARSAAMMGAGLTMMQNSRPAPAVTCIQHGPFTRCQ